MRVGRLKFNPEIRQLAACSLLGEEYLWFLSIPSILKLNLHVPGGITIMKGIHNEKGIIPVRSIL